MTEPEKKDYDVVLDALQKHRDKLWKMTNSHEEWGIMDTLRMEQIQKLDEAIKARLAQPEPVIGTDWPLAPKTGYYNVNGRRVWLEAEAPFPETAPTKKEWVSLTDDERDEIYNRHSAWVHAVEAKLKEKNT